MTLIPDQIRVSAVIPTCDRKAALLVLLDSINRSSQPPFEVLIVDSGDQPLTPEDLVAFNHLSIRCLRSERSVCIQRNLGIREACGTHIFLCDDDMELTTTYLEKMTRHLSVHPEACAVSGLVLQKEKGVWTSSYPVRSSG